MVCFGAPQSVRNVRSSLNTPPTEQFLPAHATAHSGGAPVCQMGAAPHQKKETFCICGANFFKCCEYA
jgi:hypothetical protein